MESKEEIQQILDYLNQIVEDAKKQPASVVDQPVSLANIEVGEIKFDLSDDVDSILCYDATVPFQWNDTQNQWECISFYSIDNPEPAVKINFGTGEVQLSEWMTPDSAAKLFWDRVMELNPLKIYDPQLSVFECTFPHAGRGKGTLVETLPEGPDLKTPEETALDAYTRAMKVIR